MAGENFGYGQQGLEDTHTEYSSIAFIVRQLVARMSTMKLVRVEAVHLSDADPPAPATVDVLPLVNQIDGNNNATPHGKVFGIPCFRLQGGPYAIILEPAVGDVGYVIVSDRDISAIKANADGKPANPGSRRKFDLADGVYVGGCLNPAPTTYIRFKSNGHLKIVTADGNVLETTASGFSIKGNVAITGDVAVTGKMTTTGAITAGQGTPDQVGLQTHLHTSGGAGAPTSAPTAGT